jgi:hypothetical protein
LVTVFPLALFAHPSLRSAEPSLISISHKEVL